MMGKARAFALERILSPKQPWLNGGFIKRNREALKGCQRKLKHAIKNLGLGRRMFYLLCRTLDVSRDLVGCAVCWATHSLSDLAKKIRQVFLRFGQGSCHEASFLCPRFCTIVFVYWAFLRSVRSGCRFAGRTSRGVRPVCGLGHARDSWSAALFSAYGRNQPEGFAGRGRPLAGSQRLPAGLRWSATQAPSY